MSVSDQNASIQNKNGGLVAQYFASKPEEVLDDTELERLFMDKFHEWNLPPSMTPYSFIQMLLTRSSLEKLHLRSKHFSSLVLYNWKGAATPFTVFLSLQSNQAFFSHASAMWIHGLGENNKQIRTTAPIIRSDTLPQLRRVLESLPALRAYLGDILQVVLVLDACCVQGELRWRVGPRINPAARTYLHESIVSGVVIAFAPSFLDTEIQKHLPKIAEEKGISVDLLQEEWKQFKVLIHFFEPAPSEQPDNSVDPKDVDYILALDQVNGDFVYTSDSDFLKMGARVMPGGLDRVLRDYARATTVILTVKLGSGFAMVVGGHLIYALATLIADFFRKLPPFLKLLLAAGAAIAILHPDSRKRIVEFIQKLLQNVRVGVTSILASPAVRSLVEDASRAATSRKAVLNVLPLKKGSPAIAFAYRVCQRSQVPLSDTEIADQVQASGYVSRSRNSAAYVRQILRKDSRFSLTPAGLWTLRPNFTHLEAMEAQTVPHNLRRIREDRS